MQKPILLVALLLIVAGFLLFPAKQPEPLSPYPYNPHQKALGEAIEAYFRQAETDGLIVGASVALVTTDTVLYKGGFGYQNIHQKDTVDTHSIFRLGSLSKGMTAVLAGLLVEEGAFHWEDRIRPTLEEFELNDQSATREVSLSHLLSHTVGLPYHCFTNLVESGQSLRSIARNFDTIPLIGKPGQIYSYQNAAFALSGLFIEETTGHSFESLLQKRLFQPLNMQTASFSFEAIDSSRHLARPHQHEAGSWTLRELNQKYYNAIPAGGINASMEDMIHWMQVLLGNKPDLVSDSVLQMVFEPRIDTKTLDPYMGKLGLQDKSLYGLGWRIHTFADSTTGGQDTLIHHAGSVSGYRTQLAIDPTSKVALCVLFNSPSPIAGPVVADCLLMVRDKLEAIHNWQTVQ